jgi:large subunit ribosomal protein L17
MRHNVFGRKLNRDHNHRKALFRNLIASLVEYGSITTTMAKAKSVQAMADKLMTKAKVGDVHNQRMIGRFLTKRALVGKMVNELAPLTKSRTSGFTRIIKADFRRGDQAEMVQLEWVDKVAVVAQPEPKAKPAKADSKKAEAKTDKKVKTAKTQVKTTPVSQTPATKAMKPTATNTAIIKKPTTRKASV